MNRPYNSIRLGDFIHLFSSDEYIDLHIEGNDEWDIVDHIRACSDILKPFYDYIVFALDTPVNEDTIVRVGIKEG